MLLRANALAKGTRARGPRWSLLLECVNRDVVPVVPSRGSVGASGDLAPLAHLALPFVGEGRAVVDGEELSGADALARAGLEPIRLRQGGPLASSTGPSSWRPSARLRWFAPAAREDSRYRVRAVGRGPAGLARELSAGGARSAPAAGPGRRGRQRPPTARRVGGHRGAPLVRQGAGRVLAALRATGARCEPRHSRVRRAHDRDRAERCDRQPARHRRARRAHVERELPRPAARVRARRARHGARRVRVHLRAAHRASRESVALRRPARVPHARRRAELGLHDPAVRRGGARQREQGSVPSRERRLDPDERGPGGSRVDGQRLRAQVLDRRCERRAHARDRVARRGAGGRVFGSSRAGRRWPRGARFRSHAVADRVRGSPLATDIERLATAIGSGKLVAAVEREAEAEERAFARSTPWSKSSAATCARSVAPRGTQLNALVADGGAAFACSSTTSIPRWRSGRRSSSSTAAPARRRETTTRSKLCALAAHARRGRDAARAERQAGRRVHDARGCAARADRQRTARSALGDVGGVSPARGSG